MLSRTSEYALRAMIHLARHQERWPIPGKEIADRAGIPAKYLSAVLSALVRNGVLESTRGKSGGFRMARPPGQIALMEVLAPFEPMDQRRCPFGNVQCSDEEPCLAHEQWKQLVSAEQRFLENTSVFDVAVKREKSRQRRRR